jgi:predicted ATP-grasp superfamily ATP-dependent carboligase
MSSNDRKTKLEYGDFQTPLELAEMVCRKLVELNVNPIYLEKQLAKLLTELEELREEDKDS